MAGPRSRHVLPLTVGAAFLALPFAAAPAAAGCAAPSVAVSDPTPFAGDGLEVTGEYFAAECNDTGGVCSRPRRSPPERDIPVTLQQGSSVLDEVIVDAGQDHAFIVTLTVPANAKPGDYKVIAGDAAHVPVRVRRR